jgi:hypothetical protein
VLVRFGIGRYLSSPLYQGHDQVMVPEDVASAKIVAGTANEP